jgi:hypothetical protein
MCLEVVGDLLADPKGYWIPFRKCPQGITVLLGKTFKIVRKTFYEMAK